MFSTVGWRLLWVFGFAINFIFFPLFATAQLFASQESSNVHLMLIGSLIVFITSFINVFRRHHEFQLWSQLLKMLVAIYTGIVTFAVIYRFGGVVTPEGNVSHDVYDSIYFSVVTWTTLGYGDFQPSESIRIWAGAQAMLGTLFMPLFLAAILFSVELSKPQKI
ncbi:ion channel [Marinomonas dokdonensis]|uniref:ion channel n=1 Tax=Marinomonas dokdonensis TaxID=328224 RepID=UPI0040553B57